MSSNNKIEPNIDIRLQAFNEYGRREGMTMEESYHAKKKEDAEKAELFWKIMDEQNHRQEKLTDELKLWLEGTSSTMEDTKKLLYKKVSKYTAIGVYNYNTSDTVSSTIKYEVKLNDYITMYFRFTNYLTRKISWDATKNDYVEHKNNGLMICGSTDIKFPFNMYVDIDYGYDPRVVYNELDYEIQEVCKISDKLKTIIESVVDKEVKAMKTHLTNIGKCY